MSHSSRSAHASGFTLVELLLVFSIIAVLSAMLLPVSATMRERARQTSCASNLKQLGLSIGLYTQDYDDKYPLGVVSDQFIDSDGGTPKSFINLNTLPPLRKILRPYIKETKVWSCPSDIGSTRSLLYNDMKDNRSIEIPPFSSAFELFGTSYQYHTSLGLQQVLYPAVAYTYSNPPKQIGPSQVGVLADMLGSWHGGDSVVDNPRKNVLFADGHVKNQRIVDFIVEWNRSLDPPTDNGETSPDD